jgi:uncharacterized protein YkwD
MYGSKWFHAGGALLALITFLTIFITAQATESASDPFAGPWARTDLPVQSRQVNRTWIWAPEAFTDVIQESYDEAPGGMRSVQYFDKSRMEITNPGDDPESAWYVTNGLLVLEMVEGQVQTGDTTREHSAPSTLPIAGDLDGTDAPSYADIAAMMSLEPAAEGATIIRRVNPDGTFTDDPALSAYGITEGTSAAENGRNHRTASVFWAFMISTGTIWDGEQFTEALLFQNPYYATGLPIAPPFWATVNVAGTPKDVLIQCFERRCLTFTPDNDTGWQVEAGNVGLHYFNWRYSTEGDVDQLDATESSSADPTTEPAQPSDGNQAACLNSTEAAFLGLINAYRAQNALGPLTATGTLNVASYDHSLDMNVNSYFSHTSQNGDSPWDRMTVAGYDYNTYKGENIAAGYATPQAVFDGWRNSPGHNANMLNEHFNAIGIGFVSEGHHWTTDFGGIVDAPPSC